MKEARPWTFAVGLNNGGSESTGQDRFTVTGGHTNLFNLDHQFVGAYTTSVERTEDVKQLGLSYKVPLYSLGGVMGAIYTRSDVVGNFGTFTSTGAGQTLGVNYTLYLAPQGGRRSYVTFGLEDKMFDAAQIDGTVVGADRRSRPITLGYSARTESDAAVWGYNVDLAFNTGSGRNNDLASYQSEDPRITTVHWKALRGGVSYSAPFAKTWIWSVRSQFQYSPDVLISGEQFGLGGLGSVRGTSVDRPITGDKGVFGNAGDHHPRIGDRAAAAGFPGRRLAGQQQPQRRQQAFQRSTDQRGPGPALRQGAFRRFAGLWARGHGQPRAAHREFRSAATGRRQVLCQLVAALLIAGVGRP